MGTVHIFGETQPRIDNLAVTLGFQRAGPFNELGFSTSWAGT